MSKVDILGALSAARDELAGVNGEIVALEAERARIAARPPHADDIVAAFRRGLTVATQDYEKRLGFYLNARNAAKPHAAETTANTAAQLLTVPSMLPSSDHSSLFHDPTLGFGGFPLDTAAVTYFLSDAIGAEIPSLVAKLCPDAQDGMKQAEREAALVTLDAELSRLQGARDELLSSFEAARAAAEPPVEPEPAVPENWPASWGTPPRPFGR